MEIHEEILEKKDEPEREESKIKHLNEEPKQEPKQEPVKEEGPDTDKNRTELEDLEPLTADDIKQEDCDEAKVDDVIIEYNAENPNENPINVEEIKEVIKMEEKPAEMNDFTIIKKTSNKTYTALEYRTELISIFKKYDAYDEDPTSNFYENIISILKEKGLSGLRDCMKTFNKEKREKVLRDISESSILKALWKGSTMKSPIKLLLNKEFKAILKEPEIDKYGDNFEKNGLKGLENLKKVLPDKDWRRLLYFLKQERILKSEQIRAYLEEKIIYFIDQSKISKKLEKSKIVLGKHLSDQIMEKGLENAVDELEGRFFKKKLKVK
jgi:hypothetical protein